MHARIPAAVTAGLVALALGCAEDQDGAVYLNMAACAQASILGDPVTCYERVPVLGRTGASCVFWGGAARDGIHHAALADVFVEEEPPSDDEGWDSVLYGVGLQFALMRAQEVADARLMACKAHEYRGEPREESAEDR